MIHFAPAANSPAAAARAPVSRSTARKMAHHADDRLANDNAASVSAQVHDDAVLNAALRHFAEHGLSAAGHARAQAESALAAGDRIGFQHWLAITRALDRRLAAETERRALLVAD
ncbi:MAG: hypothetical protein AAFY47_06180 [Pseudomonadota bacterium]